MTTVDLLDYTNTKIKISPTQLGHDSSKSTEINTWKILAAYMLDTFAILTASSVISLIFEVSFNSFMVANSLNESFHQINFTKLNVNLMPLMFISYYFFSYFFNQGQTWGNSVLKNRIQMPEMSFRSSLVWSIFSSAIMMTGGFSFPFTYQWMTGKGWGEFKTHDYLYANLIQIKDFAPVNLVELTQTYHAEEQEEHLQAA